MVLVDRNDYHQFQPLLYQVATSQLPAEDIARPHRTIFRDYPTVEVVTGPRRRGLARRPDPAAGRRADPHRLPPGDGRGCAARTSSACPGGRARLPALLGRGRRTPAPPPSAAARAAASGSAEGDGTLDVVVVGGGPTGVETTGALVELMPAWAKTGRDAVPGAGHAGRPRATALLGAFAEKAHRYALERLTERRGDDPARDRAWPPCTPTGSSSTTARASAPGPWSGVAASPARPIAQDAGPSPGRGGRIDVQPDLAVDGFPGVYAVGDVANIPGTRRHHAAPARLGRAAVRGRGRRRTSCASGAGARRSRSTTRTRASWR